MDKRTKLLFCICGTILLPTASQAYMYNPNYKYNPQGARGYNYQVPITNAAEGPTYYSNSENQTYYSSNYYNYDNYNNASNSNCSPICCTTTCRQPCRVTIGADFLWWKPSVDDLDYAARVIDTGTDLNENVKYEFKGLCQKWEPGVRGYLGADLGCNWNFLASYVYINSDRKESIAGDRDIVSPLLRVSQLYDFAEGHWDTNYQEVDYLIGYDIINNDCQRFRPLVGVAGLWLTQDLRGDYEFTDVDGTFVIDKVKWDSGFWGIGLRGGVDYTYNFSPCFSFFTTIDGTVLTGKARSHNKQSNLVFPVEGDESENVFKFDDSGCWQAVPGYHIRLGLSFSTCFCGGGKLSARIGYEVLQWQNIPNQRIFSLVPINGSSPNIRTYGFQGLLAGLDITF